MTEHVVVVGGGMVAHRFVEALRSRDTDAAYRVTVLGEEARLPYDRVGLSAFFAGSNPEDLTLGDPAMWDGEHVTLRTGARAMAVPDKPQPPPPEKARNHRRTPRVRPGGKETPQLAHLACSPLAPGRKPAGR